jgi:hypothetical protein
VILRWPEGRAGKQVGYCNFITGLTENLSELDFPEIMRPLFELYARLGRSLFARVVEASFKIWSNAKILQGILDNTKAIFPMLHPSLIATMRGHWRPIARQHALTTLRAMRELDPVVFEQFKMAPNRKVAAPPLDPDLGIKSRNWSMVARLAVRNHEDLDLSQLLPPITQLYGNPA